MSKGERIRDLRKEKGITQSEMAKLLRTTKQTISKYEKGIVTNIPSDRIEEIARILGTTPEYILGWEQVQIENQEPATEDDGLSESQRKLIEFAKTLDEVQAGKVLQLMQSILAFDE